MYRYLLAAVSAAMVLVSGAPPVNPELLTGVWSARWVSVPDSSPFEYGVYHFRRSFDLASKPARFIVHVSADQCYELFVNGTRVAAGPARGDLYHWRFESLDIAPQLNDGKNTIAAVVWNFGQYSPEAQLTYQTAFVLQGDTAAERVADTGPNWRGIQNTSYQPLPTTHGDVRGYYVAGPGDRVDAAAYPWGWETASFDDSQWKPVKIVGPAASRDGRDSPTRWMLVPRSIPMMEETPERIEALRQADGIPAPAGFPKEKQPVQIPAKSKVRLLLDQSHLTTAYPMLTVSAGKGATITIRYAEALVEPGDYQGAFRKGNRNEVEGKQFVGYKDVFLPDGSSSRTFRSLWWRTWRYIELEVETKDQPLTIDDFYGVFTAYPFERKATFDAGSEELQKILDVGWRTARLCAHETYMDCPYYEQLQYVGDTRIQALVSLYMSGDPALVRNAISQINDSRTPEGATYSRAPSKLQQYIPPFSLWWIGMVHDYWRYRDDPQFVKQMLPGVRAVLSFFSSHQAIGGSLGPMPWWNYVDWTRPWRNGVPPSEKDGHSAPLDLQLLLAYDWAADLESAFGSPVRSSEFRRYASDLRSTIQQLYWDDARKMFADTPAKKDFSQQSNVLAILAEVINGQEAHDLMMRILQDKELTPASIYFRHYVHSALRQVGEGDKYLDMLDEWRKMLDHGLTTWAETADPTRSDCHAWSASPNFELFRTVLGIDTAAPGFARVHIEPFLGKLDRAAGSIPHPKGEIKVTLLRDGDKLVADINLPVPGEIVWHGKTKELQAGQNKLTF